MVDVVCVICVMDKVFYFEKINYGVYSDKFFYLYFYLVFKYVDGFDYGGVFQMNLGKVYLIDVEY